MTKFHTPVLLKETLNFLKVEAGKKYIDATLGGGGHTLAIVKQGGIVLGIDVDKHAIKQAQKRLKIAYPVAQNKSSDLDHKPYILVQGNFTQITETAKKYDFTPVSGILFDLGTSTHQLTSQSRGFSFSHDSELDMRMDPTLAVTAKDLVNALGKRELYDLFTKYSQEKRARAIAHAIILARKQKPIKTTLELANIVQKVYGNQHRKLHPATKVFQALRIAVNDELNNFESALPQATDLLESGGRLITISFHEGEDRIGKHFMKHQSQLGNLNILTKKPVTPGASEISHNPSARSAKLRAAIKY